MTHTKSLSLISLFASTAIFAVLALSGCPSDESEKPKAPAAAEERARSAELAKRKREANEHPSLKLVREVFGEVSFMEPELEQEVIAHG